MGSARVPAEGPPGGGAGEVSLQQSEGGDWAHPEAESRYAVKEVEPVLDGVLGVQVIEEPKAVLLCCSYLGDTLQHDGVERVVDGNRAALAGSTP